MMSFRRSWAAAAAALKPQPDALEDARQRLAANGVRTVHEMIQADRRAAAAKEAMEAVTRLYDVIQ